MKPSQVKSYALLIIVPFLAVATLFWVLALLIQPVSGDLTRIGGWSENDFGWNSPQPVVRVVANNQTITHPDIVVLGDSFSITDNFWQSVISRELDEKVLTFGIDSVGCINNWAHWASDDSGAKTVIIETVERLFVRRFRSLGDCPAVTPVPADMAAGITASRRATWPPTLDLKYLLRTAVNSVRLYAAAGQSLRVGNTVNVAIRPGCARFSNKLSGRLLYYAGDDRKKRWTADEVRSAVNNVRMLQDEFTRAGKQFIFLLVPDKSSVYQHCFVERSPQRIPDATQQLILAGVNTPDLMTVFRNDSGKIEDLYFPDNTHLSERGYLVLAEQVRRLLTKRATQFHKGMAGSNSGQATPYGRALPAKRRSFFPHN